MTGHLPHHSDALYPETERIRTDPLVEAYRQEIAALRTAARQQDTRLAQLTHLALALEKEMLAARQAEEMWEANYHSELAEWERLRHSPGYALLGFLQRLRARTVPPGSRREGMLQMAAGWLRIANQRGVKGLLVHLRGEARWRWKAFTRRIGPRRCYRNQIIEIPLPPTRPPITPHTQAVDLVVCVHNALEDVRRCLDSVLRHTAQPYRLLLVDDGSDPPTQGFLADFARQHSHAILLRSDEATGYTFAANRGLRASTAPFVLLLNSDTIATPGWLDKLLACADSDPKIGLAGPLSNTASYQSIPALSAGGDWAENPLPDGWELDDWATALTVGSARLYPKMPLLNGFCLLIRREVIDAIGYFDEDAFGAGYGEENDYCLRAQAAGWRLALADDTYFFHAQSRSYSHSRRRELSRRASRILTERYGSAPIAAAEDTMRNGPVLLGIRSRAAVLAERFALVEEGRQHFSDKRLLFLLPVDAPGGGANVVLAEAGAMAAMGVEVHLFNLTQNRQLFAAAYPDNRLSVHYGSPESARVLGQTFDAVIATWHESVEWLPPSAPALGYYVQDFEAHFFAEGSDEQRRAAASYTARPALRCFTKTGWNRQEVLAHTGVDCAIVGPSVDIDRFRPLEHPWESAPPVSSVSVSSPIRITAMIRPNSPRRGPRLTMETLRRLSRHYGERVVITLFGVSPTDPGFAELPQGFDWQLAGMLETDRVAVLLGGTDIFVDFSTYQAMGLTALEAMACGAAVIVPQKGGAGSFSRHGENVLMVDTSSAEACWRALRSLVDDEYLRARLRTNAIRDVCTFFPERAALNILAVLFGKDSESGAL
ncbi:MAG: glycosyltransferase [Caldilineaceae bacterium]|nr:glycosyltransferase [Caldilineaceae bacterium]